MSATPVHSGPSQPWTIEKIKRGIIQKRKWRDVTWQRKLIKLRLGWNWKPIKTLCRNFEHIFSLSPNDKSIVVLDIYTQQSLSKIQNINHQAAALSRMDSILIVPCNSSAHWPHLAIKTQEPSHQYYTYCLPSVTHAPFVSFYYT